MTSFWKKGFDILENMEDKFAIEGSHHRAIDPLTESTSCRGSTTDAKDEKSNKEQELKDISDHIFYEICMRYRSLNKKYA